MTGTARDRRLDPRSVSDSKRGSFGGLGLTADFDVLQAVAWLLPRQYRQGTEAEGV